MADIQPAELLHLLPCARIRVASHRAGVRAPPAVDTAVIIGANVSRNRRQGGEARAAAGKASVKIADEKLVRQRDDGASSC